MLKFTVVTPTWSAERHDVLLNRCMPSVRNQRPNAGQPLSIEHVVVSDGPDPELQAKMDELNDPTVTYLELPFHEDHKANFGQRARNEGLKWADGEYIAYLDSDNAYRPDHLAVLGVVLPDLPGFAFTQMVRHPAGDIIGTPPPEYGHIDTSLIAHHKQGLYRYCGWPSDSDMLSAQDYHAPDWEFVRRWLERGAAWRFVPQVTVDYYS